MNTRALLEQAIAIAGSEKKLGQACGCSQHKIWKAKVNERVDAELALLIERATNGIVPAAQLRPDLPWPEELTEPIGKSLAHTPNGVE